ncbi:MAG TPA: hypothetical protein VM165_02380, partial [Planctomycetaceae bacterium]|nr:hypothetical protein [Planctomycetaceae bacterium]
MSSKPTTPDAHGAAAKAGGHDVPAPKKRRFLLMGLAGTAAILLVGGVTWCFIAPTPVTPIDRLQDALKLIDAGEIEAAREIAKALEEDKYHDEAFPGGVDYVLGMAEYLSIAEAQAAEVAALKAATISYLKEAEHQGLPDERRTPWAFALGSCLESVGQSTAAQPLLEEVAGAEGPNRLVAASLLIELYLDPSWNNDQRLSRALDLSDMLLNGVEPKTPAAEAAVLQHAAVQLALGDLTKAETAITQAGLDPQLPAVLLVRGRMLMAADRLPEALALLEKVPVNEAAQDNAYRPALYLMGQAAERQAAKLTQSMAGEGMQRTHNAADRSDYRQRAVEYYRKAIHAFADSDEALVAGLALGRMEQQSGAHEKALQLYGAALRAANRSDDFRNRWISLDHFREKVREAWALWIEGEHFAEAIALAELMTPVFPRDQAYDLSALAYRGWADKSEKEFAKASVTERAQRTEALRQLF